MIREVDAHRAFRALLESLARPGHWVATPATDAAAAVELLRHAAWQDDPLVEVTDAASAARALKAADPGTEEEPERSTTLVVLTGEGVSTAVTLAGPGVREPFDVHLPLDRKALALREALCADYPRGVDLVLIDESGRVLGLPRTSAIGGVG